MQQIREAKSTEMKNNIRTVQIMRRIIPIYLQFLEIIMDFPQHLLPAIIMRRFMRMQRHYMKNVNNMG